MLDNQKPLREIAGAFLQFFGAVDRAVAESTILTR
jgi:hypothetical protein